MSRATIRKGWPRSAVCSLAAVVLLASCSYFPTTENDYKKSRSIALLKPPEGVVIPPADRTYRVPEAPDESADAEVDEPAPTPTVSATATGETPSPKPKVAEPKQSGIVEKPAVVEKPSVKAKPTMPIFVTRQDLTHRMTAKKPAAAPPKKAPKTATKIATEKNSFELIAPPEKVWPRLVTYWMQRGIPLIESNPETGKILTDWVLSADPGEREKGVRDQFEVLLERSKQGSKITVVHKASRKTSVKGGKSEWALLGTDPALQGTETVRLRSYLTGK